MSKPYRVVGSLTTMPNQYFKLPGTLSSLNNQTRKLDAIYLGLPQVSRRMSSEYPELPQEISKLCTVVRCEDYGPITKIVPGLLMETDPNTVVITFDNDMHYHPDTVAKLIEHHESYPESAIGSSGMLLKYKCPACAITPNENEQISRVAKFAIPNEGRRVDSVYGYPGALYTRGMFPSNEDLEKKFLDYALLDNNMLMNDDIVISGYLSLHNVERRIFPNMPEVGFTLTNGVRERSGSEISYNIDKFFQRMNLAIDTARSQGMYAITEPMDSSETIIGVSAIIVLCFLAALIIFIYLIVYGFGDWFSF